MKIARALSTRRLLSVFVLLALVNSPAHADAEGKARAKQAIERFLKEEPAIRAHYAHVTGSCEFKDFLRQLPLDLSPARLKDLTASGPEELAAFPEVLILKVTSTFAQDGDKKKIDSVFHVSKKPVPKKLMTEWPDRAKGPDGPSRIVTCLNGARSFVLQWEGHPRSPVVTSFGSEDVGKHEWLMPAGTGLMAPYSLAGTTFADHIRAPEVELIDATEVTVEGHRCVRIIFNSAHMTPGKSKSPMKYSAAVVLSPEEGWIIRGHELGRGPWPPSLKSISTVEYEPSREGYPPLKRLTTQLGGNRRVHEFTHWEHAPASSSEFAITSYGLPDLGRPPAEHRRWSNPGPWLIAGAGGFFALAVWLRWYSQRGNRDRAGDGVAA